MSDQGVGLKAQTKARPRPLPQRTCVACGSTTAKRQLVRVVRTTAGEVRPDPTGKAPGRGAYLCSNPDCWDKGVRKGRLERSLKVKLSPEDREALSSFARTFVPGSDL